MAEIKNDLQNEEALKDVTGGRRDPLDAAIDKAKNEHKHAKKTGVGFDEAIQGVNAAKKTRKESSEQ